MSNLTNPTMHECGGTIVTAELDGATYGYCENCRAFSYNGDVPTGTDPEANRESWDNGDDHSPSA